MNRTSAPLLGSCCVVALLISGCASVEVTSEPSGAKVYNACGMMQCGSAFRNFKPYDQVEGSYRGKTPCKYTRWGDYVYDNVRVVWADGTSTPWEQQGDPPWRCFWRRDLKFHFTKEASDEKPVEPAH
jgi:hypothetical protein